MDLRGRDNDPYAFLPRAELLTFEEITRLARVFAEHGVSKVRLIGGEPLLRRGLERLVEMLAGIQGSGDNALTTNGTALAAKAQVLKSAGLSRVTVVSICPTRRRSISARASCCANASSPTTRHCVASSAHASMLRSSN